MPKPKKEEFTKEEEKIIDETVKAEVREELPPKTGVVLTGGIDSSVMLCKVKRIVNNEIQPIVFKEEIDNTAAIKDILEHEGVHATIKTFNKANTKAEKKEILQYCYENNISPLYFAGNQEEYERNIGISDIQDWKQISADHFNSAVVIDQPLRQINKSILIQWANDYGILPLTAKPNDSPKYKKLRAEAFAEANRQIYKADDKILDPYADAEKPEVEQ